MSQLRISNTTVERLELEIPLTHGQRHNFINSVIQLGQCGDICNISKSSSKESRALERDVVTCCLEFLDGVLRGFTNGSVAVRVWDNS